MVDVESRLLARLSQAAILTAVRCPLNHLAAQVGGNGHHPIRFANLSAPTAAAGATGAPPINQPLGFVPLRISQRCSRILLVEQLRQPLLNSRRQS